MKRLAFTIMFVCLLLASCSTDLEHNRNSKLSAPASRAIKPKILFEIRYVNFAWGIQRSLIYIDHKGGIYKYVFTQGDNLFTESGRNIYTEQELEDKYNHNRKLIGSISPEILAEKVKLIEPASKGKYSESVSRGADQGATTIACYIYDEATKHYREVVLNTKGDVNYENLSNSAKDLVVWLESLNLSAH